MISDVGFKRWCRIDYSADPYWEFTTFNHEVLQSLKKIDDDEFTKECLKHFTRLPISSEDLCLENFGMLSLKFHFKEIYQHFMIVIEKGTYKPNTLEEPLFDLAI